MDNIILLHAAKSVEQYSQLLVDAKIAPGAADLAGAILAEYVRKTVAIDGENTITHKFLRSKAVQTLGDAGELIFCFGQLRVMSNTAEYDPMVAQWKVEGMHLPIRLYKCKHFYAIRDILLRR